MGDDGIGRGIEIPISYLFHRYQALDCTSGLRITFVILWYICGEVMIYPATDDNIAWFFR